MRKQALLNLFMLLLVLGLAALVLWGPQAEKTPPAPVHLTALQPGDVRRVEIAVADRPPVRLSRQGERWFVDGAQRWPADDDRVHQVLALAVTVSHASYPLAELDAAEVGLAAPRVTLRLDDTTFALGAQEPLNHYRYVQVGDRVHLITDTLIHQLSAQPLDWVSPRLVPEGSEIVALQLPGLTLRRDTQGAWVADPPHAQRSQKAYQRLADAWRQARARSVTAAGGDPGDALRIGLDAPADTLRYTRVANGNDLILERTDRGLRYTLDAALEPQLLHLPVTESTP